MSRRTQFAVIPVAVLACAPLSAQDSWTYELMPFLWAGSIDGREGVNNVAIDVSESFDDIVEFVDVGGAMRIAARRAPIAWFGEASYVELEDSVATGSGGATAELKQTFAEGGLSYDVNDQLAVYGAVRYQRLDMELTGIPVPLKGKDDWADAVAGLWWTPIETGAWVGWLRGDVGGGSSDLVWLTEAGLGYGFAERWRAYIGYRILDTDYASGGFIYNVRQSGVSMGVGFQF